MKQESTGVYLRLSAMMFLQFAVWGAWAVLIAGHMGHLGFTGRQISYVFGTTAFGALVSPLVAGWVADRFVPNQIFTAICHFLGAPLMYLAWLQTAFLPLWTCVFLYAVLYMPTIALTNAIAFHHTKDSRKFGNIRVWGTLGWIAINWGMSAYLRFWEGQAPGQTHVGDCLLTAAVLSALMGLYCLTLPHTPPAREAKNLSLNLLCGPRESEKVVGKALEAGASCKADATMQSNAAHGLRSRSKPGWGLEIGS